MLENGNLDAIIVETGADIHAEFCIKALERDINVLSDIVPELKERLDKIENRKEEIIEAAEIRIKYKGYIEREKVVADKMHRLENIKIKGRFNYSEMQQLSTEARQKLNKINPETLAQASRIPGVSPSDINVLLVLVRK